MSQKEEILNHLKSGKTLTALQAVEKFGCLRLGSRIHELKREGNKIKTELVTLNKKNLAVYSIEEEANETSST